MTLSGYTDTTPDISTLNPVALDRARMQAKALAGLGDPDNGDDLPTMSFDDVMRVYNSGITDDEIRAWVYWKRSARKVRDDYAFITSEWSKYVVPVGAPGDPVVQRWVETGIMFYHAGTLLPLPIYTYGNIYDRILQLEKDKEHITTSFGADAYQMHKDALDKAKPRMLSLLHPDPNERPIIKAISDVAVNKDLFAISSVREEYLDTETAEELKLKAGRVEVKNKRRGYREKTIVLDGSSTYDLNYVFAKWLFTLKEKDFRKSSPVDVASLYLLNGSIRDKDVSAVEKAERKQNARIEGEEKFAQFLHEVLTFEDQQKLDLIWNRLYNGWGELNYERVPIGFVCSQTFKNRPLQITPIQRQGIAFMEAMGSGINAFDVGVGKTMTAIATLAHMISTCKAQRPLVVVPKPTYQKWLAEIGGYTDRKTGKYVTGFLSGTGITINDWFNLGTDTDAVLDKPVAARSITVVTYEGFKRIGLGSNVSEAMVEELARILTQPGDDESARDKEQEKQKLREMIGIANSGTRCDVDTLGFDFVVIDEAHRAKNVFDRVAADEEEGSRYNMTGGQSATGVKAFLMLNYLQRQYGSCSMLLTATPFTNSPLEIYSMLSLVAYPSMVAQNIENIRDFFDLFVAPTLEYVVTARDQIETREVIKGFTNRILLQKLINGHILYRTGEEAGVTRPVKVNLPLLYEYEDEDGNGIRDALPKDKRVLTYLKMTERQEANQDEIISTARNANVREDPGVMLRCLNWSLNNALSPFLFEGTSPEDEEELMEESPKLKFVMGCIGTVKKWHETRGEGASGQVIYMNRGKDLFPLIKLYLEKHVGYKKAVPFEGGRIDEVEIIESSVSEERKEKIKSAFLEGACKVIIGTATIREGIDLQKNGTVIYNCYPEWNPTDMRQLEGRIWRQGNRYKYVRICMPLIQDSMDVFVFQKLEEKTARINDVWSKADRGNVLDVESLDPNEVKIALISDLDKLVKMEFDEERQEASKAVKRAADDVAVIEGADFSLRKYRARKETLISGLRTAYTNFSRLPLFSNVPTYAGESVDGLGRVYTESERLEYKDAKKIYDKAVEIKEALAALSVEDDKALLALARKAIQANNTYFQSGYLSVLVWPAEEFKESLATVSKFESTILKPKGYNLQSDLAPVKADYQKVLSEKEAIAAEYPHDSAKAMFSARWQKLKEEIAEKKAALAIDGRPPEQRADEFATLNDKLLSARRPEAEKQDIAPDKGSSRQQSAADYNAEQEALAAIALMEMLELEMEMGGDLAGTTTAGRATIDRNTSRNGIEVMFSGAPPFGTTQYLKGKCFRYSRRQNLWYVTFSQILFDEVKTKLFADGFIVNGKGGELAPEEVEAAKQRMADEAALKQQALHAKYLAERAVEHAMALRPFDEFAAWYIEPLNSEKQAKPDLTLMSGTVLKWDGAKRDFWYLPTGRKRPDRYELSQVKEMLMRDALKCGVVVPLGVYFSTPTLQYTHHPDLQLDHIKRLVAAHPQQATAADYKRVVWEVEGRVGVQLSLRQRWAKYRSRVIPPLLAKGQTFWTKEKGKGREVVWSEWACKETPEELARPADRGYGANIALQRMVGYIQFHTTFPLDAVYLAKEATQSILALYPVKDVLEDGVAPDAGNNADEEAAAAIALMEMLELEMAF